MKQLPLPDFVDFKNYENFDYSPNLDANFEESALKWKKKNDITNASTDKKKIRILNIDNQKDFNYPVGKLYVAGRSGSGAIDAQKKALEFCYKYMHCITEITNTLDTHFIHQVFFASCHLDENGNHPLPGTEISHQDYLDGKFRANPAVAHEFKLSPPLLQKQFAHYTKTLEYNGKYKLMIWPYHCILGNPGHSLAGGFEEFTRFHSLVRGAFNLPELKGGSPFTEHYSIFGPEVTTFFDGSKLPNVGKNTKLVSKLSNSDVVIIFGQAGSHCVPATIDDFLNELKENDESLIKKVYILKDCTDAVVIPNGPDFTEQMNESFRKFEDAGMHVVESTTPIEDWPEIQL